MNLTDTNDSIEVLLGGAVTTNQSKVLVDYVDHFLNAGTGIVENFLPDKQISTTNSATPVTILSSPPANVRRSVRFLDLQNADTANITVTIRYNDNTTTSNYITAVLSTGERLEYTDVSGFSVYDTFGAKKVTAVQNVVEPGYIDGFKLNWTSVNSLTFSSGTCYIPSLGRNVNSPGSILVSGIALGVSTFGHAYFYLNSGVPSIEVVTTAPSAPYNGVARTKTGDTTRRYLGSVLTDSAGNIYEFDMLPESAFMQYRTPLTNAAPFRVLSGGAATVPTNISLTGIVPTTATIAYYRCINTSTTGAIVFYYNSTYSAPNGIVGNTQQAFAGSTFTGDLIMPCVAQNIAYSHGAPPAAFLDVKGYWYER